MLTESVLESIRDSRGFEKKREFVNLLTHMVNYRDEHQDTRAVTLSIIFRHFASRERRAIITSLRNVNEEPDQEDDLLFMTGTQDDDTDFDEFPIIPEDIFDNLFSLFDDE